MFSVWLLIGLIILFMGALLIAARWAEHSTAGRKMASLPVIYGLSLAVYCTTWTFYGSVGKAATGGMSFITIYLGPTLLLFAGGHMIERVVRIKQRDHITSIADFISARYGKSQAVAAMVTIILLIGIVPYVGLQLKGLSGSAKVMTAAAGVTPSELFFFSPIMVVLMSIFTIVFGIRHLDPTERHPGMVFAIAVAAIVKIIAFIGVGAFVLNLAFGNPIGFLESLDRMTVDLPNFGAKDSNQVILWLTLIALSTSAFALLPRQFHVSVIEASDAKHINTAKWLTPLYLFAINLFVVPIALGGKLFAGEGVTPDQYVLAIPMQKGQYLLSLFVFIGGFAAAAGMIMISAMTMSTMVANHLLMPIIHRFESLRGFQRYLLYLRWVVCTLFISAGYMFEVGVGGSYMLVAIGLVSFAAAFVLAPVFLVGMLWREASRKGAILALSGGFGFWLWTLLIPTFIKSGWLSKSILTEGPFGFSLLRPEALLGLAGAPSLTHGSVWSGGMALLLLVLGSVLFPADDHERKLTDAFLANSEKVQDAPIEIEKDTEVAAKYRKAIDILSRFYPMEEAQTIVNRILEQLGLESNGMMSSLDEVELKQTLENTLAGAIGSATAHAVIKEWGEIEVTDPDALMQQYARILTDLKLSPKQLNEQVNFQAEREKLLTEQFQALQQKIDERDAEIVERQKAEEALQEAHDKLEERVRERTAALAIKNRDMRLVLDNVDQGFMTFDLNGFMSTERSAIFKKWFGSPVRGDTVVSYFARLDASRAEMLDLSLELLREDIMPEGVIMGQFPDKLTCGPLTLKAEFSPVKNQAGVTDQILAVISDVTKALQQKKADQIKGEIIRILEHMSQNRLNFMEFYEEANKIVKAIVDNECGSVNALKMALHTLKGNSGLYGLDSVASLCHDLEELVEESGQPPSSEEIEPLNYRWREIGTEIRRFQGNTDAIEVSNEDYESMASAIRAQESHASLGELLDSWKQSPTQARLDVLATQTQRMVERLHRGPVDVRVEHNNLRLEPQDWAGYWSSMVHVLRNAVDHGLESSEERVTANKGRAEILLRTAIENGEFVVEVKDNGRGINWDHVSSRAKEKGIPSESPEDLKNALFHPGFTTRDEVSAFSGRGVGLSAILEETQMREGRIEIDSELGQGTSMRFVFPYQKTPSGGESSAIN